MKWSPLTINGLSKSRQTLLKKLPIIFLEDRSNETKWPYFDKSRFFKHYHVNSSTNGGSNLIKAKYMDFRGESRFEFQKYIIKN